VVAIILVASIIQLFCFARYKRISVMLNIAASIAWLSLGTWLTKYYLAS
jgi:hypothetical protein